MIVALFQRSSVHAECMTWVVQNLPQLEVYTISMTVFIFFAQVAVQFDQR